MVEVNIHEAKTHLSRLLQRVAAGEEVIISKAGKPLARIIPFRRSKGERPLGQDQGAYCLPEDFNAALPRDVLDAFEGKS